MSLIHAEYIKLSRRRLYPVMLAVLTVFMALAAFFLIAFARIAPELAGEVPSLEKPVAYLIGAQQAAGQTWFPLILAAVILGGEFGSTVWATALTRDPRRWAHILARLLVLTLAGWAAFLFATGIWGLIALFSAGGTGSPSIGEWIGLFWRLGLISLAWSSLGLGLVAVLRSIGPAIGAAIGFSFLEGILALWDPYENVSLSAATTGMFDFVFGQSLAGFVPGADLSVAHAVAIVAGWTVVGILLGWWGLQRRDA
ncbi:MAG: hypothetical protein ACE5F5_07870 [Acidimicrobiia bacterium]